MTVLASGISMYALAILMEKGSGLGFQYESVDIGSHCSGLYLSGRTVFGDIQRVLQFFIIVIGLLPLVFLSLKDVGGWSGLKAGLEPVAVWLMVMLPIP
jgi:SSS family solute:Na+ symporter